MIEKSVIENVFMFHCTWDVTEDNPEGSVDEYRIKRPVTGGFCMIRLMYHKDDMMWEIDARYSCGLDSVTYTNTNSGLDNLINTLKEFGFPDEAGRIRQVNSTERRPSGWMRYEDITGIGDVTVLSCDTRDFRCLPFTGECAVPEEAAEHDGDDRYMVSKYAVTGMIRLLESRLKEKGYFKMMESGWEKKYIRFYESPGSPDEFIVCDRNGNPFDFMEFLDDIR